MNYPNTEVKTIPKINNDPKLKSKTIIYLMFGILIALLILGITLLKQQNDLTQQQIKNHQKPKILTCISTTNKIKYKQSKPFRPEIKDQYSDNYQYDKSKLNLNCYKWKEELSD